MDSLRHLVELRHRGELLRTLVLRDRPLDLGSAPSCDVVIPDAELRPRAALLEPGALHVSLRRVRSDGRLSSARVLSTRPVSLGFGYQLRLRVAEAEPQCLDDACTDSVPVPELRSQSLVLWIGKGPERVRRRVGARPISVGSAEDNDLVLRDRAVSRHHCRFEPLAGGCLVRDLESRNGTWLAGLRVGVARVPVGSRLRLGRTEVCLEAETIEPAAERMVARSSVMIGTLAEARRFAQLEWPVLIHGETGSGKEGLARLIHAAGRGGPLVVANAGGLPDQLLESELFGHERGAFTGAERVHKGFFERASGGTLFLDEVGELSLRSQAQLLRVLETWHVCRVGGETEIPVDVRLVCATHRDLRALVEAGSFRMDLYYRIARLVLEVPPLRTRSKDVVALAEHFLEQLRPELGPRRLGRDVVPLLLHHGWPGNVRELRNVICVAATRCSDGVLDADALLPILRRAPGQDATELGYTHVAEIVASYDGNVSAAARALGIPRSTLRGRLRLAAELAIDASDGRPRGPGLARAEDAPGDQRMTRPA